MKYVKANSSIAPIALPRAAEFLVWQIRLGLFHFIVYMAGTQFKLPFLNFFAYLF